MRLRLFKFLNALIMVGLGAERLLGDELPERDPDPPGRVRSSSTATSRSGLAGRLAHRRLVRDQPRRQRAAEGGQRRLPGLRRHATSTPRFEFADPTPKRDSRLLRRPRQRPRLHRLRRGDPRHPAQRHRLHVPRQPAGHPVRRHLQRRLGQRGLLGRLLLGLGGADHRATAGGWRCASRSRRCATTPPRPIRRCGGSCSTATTPATAATRSSARACRGAATASSATPGPMVGLEGLPSGDHLVRRPLRQRRTSRTTPEDGLGTPLRSGDAGGRAGLDAKWNPNPDTVRRRHPQPRLLAGRVRRRPDLLQRALRPLLPGEAPVLPGGARPVLDPDPGGLHPHRHLAALGGAGHRQGRRDRLHRAGRPGPRRRQRHPPRRRTPPTSSTRTSSRPSSSAGCGATSGAPSPPSSPPTGRSQGGGYNRVLGPDFKWRPSDRPPSRGQLLCGETRDAQPPRPGRRVGRPAAVRPRRPAAGTPTRTRLYDAFVLYNDFADGFRADDGFVPQVGYRAATSRWGAPSAPRTTGFAAALLRRTSTTAPTATATAALPPDASGVGTRRQAGTRSGGPSCSSTRCAAARSTFARTPARLIFEVRPVAADLRDLLRGRPGRRSGLRQRPRRASGATPPAQRRRPPHRPLRPDASTAARRWLDVDAGAAGRGPPVHRPGGPAAGQLHLHPPRSSCG